jgi:hypothetical protein
MLPGQNGKIRFMLPPALQQGRSANCSGSRRRAGQPRASSFRRSDTYINRKPGTVFFRIEMLGVHYGKTIVLCRRLRLIEEAKKVLTELKLMAISPMPVRRVLPMGQHGQGFEASGADILS